MTHPNPKDPQADTPTEDKFYGQLDNIIMWCFELGFNAARREYGEQYKSAQEAEPNYEDNLDSWVQDIITSHEELFQAHQQELLSELLGELPMKRNKMGITDIYRTPQELEVYWADVNGFDQAIDQVVSVIQSKIGE